MSMTSASRARNEVSGARLCVVGIGGAGSNAVNRMLDTGLNGVNMIAMNTDQDALRLCRAPLRLALGPDTTRGLGAGGDPGVGKRAAEETRTDIKRALQGSDMVFLTAGMGGGTGTGASPIVADVARELGALTVAVVTKPFGFEGPRRRRLAEAGIDELRSRVDTVIVVPNDRLLEFEDQSITLTEAFACADDMLRQGVQGISDIITIPGCINVDFADVEATMRDAGTAMMGIGQAEGPDRAVEAARLAVSSPLLETSVSGALRVLINVTSGPDLTLAEAHDAATLIRELCHPDEARIIVGWVLDKSMEGRVRITVLATGFSEAARLPERAATHNAERARPMPDVEPVPVPVPAAAQPDERQAAPVSVQTILAAQAAGDDLLGTLDEDELDRPTFFRRR